MTVPLALLRQHAAQFPPKPDEPSEYEEDGFVVADHTSPDEGEKPNISEDRGTKRKRVDELLGEITTKLRSGRIIKKDDPGIDPLPNLNWKSEVVQKLQSKPIDPNKFVVVGRDKEVGQILRMLAQPRGGMRPLLLGETGVGKKAIVRKVAYEIAAKRCPEVLKDRAVYLIDCANLLGVRISQRGRDTVGQFFRHELEKILRKEKNPILFFRDINKVLGVEYINDFLLCFLKSDLNCLASISGEIDEETEKKIAQLHHMNFDSMNIEECSKAEALKIVKHKLEKYPLNSNITLRMDTLEFAVNLSNEYITSRPFPIKAINVIRECANGLWQRYVKDAALAPGEEVAVNIKRSSIAQIVHEKTGIPTGYLLAKPWESLLRLEQTLNDQIIGQKEAIRAIVEHIGRMKMGFTDSKKPMGSFLCIGPTGVGKTELARRLAKELFFHEDAFIMLDMTEYKESHTVSRLIGAPAGYVGYDTESPLFTKLKKRPHCVILVDELEKAHLDVRLLLLQIMEEGRLTDGKGNLMDFRHALILMTSNLGSDQLVEMANNRIHTDAKTVLECIKPTLIKKLSPEFCGRLSGILAFEGLHVKDIPKVVEAHMKRLKEEYSNPKKEYPIDLDWDKSVIDFFAAADYDQRLGMRPVCTYVREQVSNTLTKKQIEKEMFLTGLVKLTVEKGVLVVKAS